MQASVQHANNKTPTRLVLEVHPGFAVLSATRPAPDGGSEEPSLYGCC